ncbi:TonB-dependent receptor [Tsuneonella mangrovi]|uniref:TonB-dependent receptor n=1 Tax=Tsuneonella mangrovi TaxID=1982042 RepID=UPI000BA2776D|nr:TonB-dependent receptor [Tsuneonella mangrovi]
MTATRKCRLMFGASAAVLAMIAVPAYAQDTGSTDKDKATTNQASQADQSDNEIVVIGTPGGSGIRKQEASYAITTISQADLNQAAPKSTAEVFDLVPGVWTESSGGVSGANIDVRGLPGGGDAPWVTFQVNGSPIYGTESLSFMEQSSIFRVDETIASTEAAHGGPNAVFSNGEVGVTMNFNLKKGGDETKGLVKLSTSSYHLGRIDAVISGPLGNDLYYMIGGYVSRSPGIRDAQFDSERGQQITAQLTKKLDNGEINLWTRWTDDHGQWYLPMALNTGNDLGTFSQLGNATRFVTLQVDAQGDSQTYDLANGRGWKGSVSGLNLNFDLGGGWGVRDNASFTDGDADTYGFVPDGAPVTVADFLAANPTYTSLSTAGGTALASGDWIQNYGGWVVQKKIQSLTNDLSLDYQSGINTLTVGYYHAGWSSNDFWSLGNFAPVQNVQNGDHLEAGVTCEMLQNAGSGSGCWHYGIRSAGDARADAVYLADSIQATDALRFDLGVRQQWLSIDYVLDSGPGYPDGTTDLNTHVTGSKFSYTGAINYDVSNDLGLFVRYSKGYRMPNFDDLRSGNQNVYGVSQVEGGVKFRGYNAALYLTGFYNRNNSFEATVGSVLPATAFKTRAYGVELDGNVHYGGFKLDAIMTLQDAKVTDSSTPSQVGNAVLRQPNFQARLSPSYSVDLGSVNFTLYGAVSMVGKRWADLDNTVRLDGYTKVDLGMKADLPSGLFAQVSVDNLNDSHGLTEGDPRNPTAPNGRPILGRSAIFSIGYNF